MPDLPDTRPAVKRWLKQLREQQKLSQEDLADVLGVDRRQIVNWEGKGGLPGGVTFLRYIRALGVEITPPAPLPEDEPTLRDQLAAISEALGVSQNASGSGAPDDAPADVADAAKRLADSLEEARRAAQDLSAMAAAPDSARYLKRLRTPPRPQPRARARRGDD